MTRFFLALVLVGGVAISGDAPAVEPQTLLSVPGTTSAAPFESGPTTVLNWNADDWNAVRLPQSLSVTPWSKDANVTVEEDSASCPLDAYGEPMDRVSSAAGGSTLQTAFQQVFPGQIAAGGVFTTSFDMAAPIGVSSVPASVRVACGAGNPTAIACSRSDGGACNTSVVSTTNAVAATTLTSQTPVTLNFTTSCLSSTTSLYPTIQAGHYGTSKGYSICASNARVTRGAVPMPWRRPLGRDLNTLTTALQTDFSSWSTSTLVVAAPVVTTNVVVAPDGTLTADRIDFPAYAAGQVSVKYTSTSVRGQAGAFAVWLRAAAPTSITLSVQTGGVGSWKTCQVATTWSLCTLYFAGVSAAAVPAIGPDARLAGHPASGTATTIYAAQASLALYGDTFAATGTVPQVNAPAAFPRGTSGHRSVGPFSTANYFSLTGGAADPIDLAGPFTACAVFDLVSTGAIQPIVHNATSGSSGYRLELDAGGKAQIRLDSGGIVVAATANSPTVGARNVACWGRDASKGYAKLNGGASASVNIVSAQVASPLSAIIGTNGAQSATSRVVEMWFTSTAWDETNVNAIQTAALANGDGARPYFMPDVGTALHLRGDAFDGVAWSAPQATTTVVGTTPYTDAWTPMATGLTGSGFGPFTDANYLTLNATSDVLDSTGDRWGCVLFTPPVPTANAMMLVNNGHYGTAGYGAGLAITTGAFQAWHTSGAAASSLATTANNAVPNGPNVACWWKTNNVMNARLNYGATASGTSFAETSGTGRAMIIGRGAPAAINFPGTVHAVTQGLGACPDTSCEVWATKQINRALGQVSAHNQALANARSTVSATNATRDATTGAAVRALPIGVTGVEGPGLGVWRQSTNAYPYSGSPCQAGNVVQAGWTFYNNTCANDVVTGPDGQPADQFTQAANSGGPYTTVTLASTSTATASVYGKRVSGTGYIGAMVQCATGLVSCTCRRDDGGACTATPGTGLGPLTRLQCVSKASIDSSRWVRLSAEAVCGGPATAFTAAGYPGEPGVTTADTAYLAAFQVEAGLGPTPYTPTTTAAVQRNGDNVTVEQPIPAQEADWCVSGTYTPGRAWANPEGLVNTLWAMGATDTINSARLEMNGPALTFRVWPGAGGPLVLAYPLTSVASGSHAVKACMAGGRLALLLDGNIVTATASPPVTTTLVPLGAFGVAPTSMTLGARVGGSAQWDGYVRDFKAERSGLQKADLDAYDALVALEIVPLVSGAALAEDANTVAHVLWNGTSLIDTRTNITNLVYQSEAFDNVAWTSSGSGVAAPVVTANQALSPTGTMTADRIDLPATTNNTQYGITLQAAPTVTFAIGVTYTAEVWLRAVSGTANVYLTMTDFSDANTGTTDCLVTEAWSRCSVTHTRTASSATYMMLGTDARRTSHADVRAGASVYAWGAQMHQGSFTPTYVPTASAVASSGPVPNQTSSSGLWSMNGTVPQVAAIASPFVPGTAGAGPFSATNSYQGATTLMDWTADWSLTAVFSVTALAANTYLIAKTDPTGTSGWSVRTQTDGSARLTVQAGALSRTATCAAGSIIVNAINVITVSASGGILYCRANTAAVVTGTYAPPFNPASNYPVRIGRIEAAGSESTATTVYEIIAGNTPYSDALHDARVRQVFGMIGQKGEALTVTRTTSPTTQFATYYANGRLWNAQPSVLRVEAAGALSESTRINYGFPSEDLSLWTQGGTTPVTTNQGPANWTDLDLVTTGHAEGSRFATNTTGSTAGPMTACAWMASNTVASKDGAVFGWSNGQVPSGISCRRSDGGACTTGVASNSVIYANASVGMTPVRLCVTWTAATAQTTHTVGVHDGNYTSTFGTGMLFGRASLEIGPHATSYIAATAATTRNGDVTSMPTPAGLAATDDFAVRIGFGYGNGRAPTTSMYLWAWDNTSGSNDQILYFNSATKIDARYYVTDNTTFRVVAITPLTHAAGSKHAILTTFSQPVRRIYDDGVLSSTDAIQLTRTEGTMPPALYFGNNSAGSAGSDSNVYDFKVWRTADAARTK